MTDDCLVVRVSMEYGFEELVWYYPGTLHELFTDYAAGNVPHWGEPTQRIRGNAHDMPDRMSVRRFDIHIHIHEEDDSDLRYGHWAEDPTATTEDKMRFHADVSIEGLPGQAQYDAVTALALAAVS
jgi:hypothetical protein